MNYRFLSSIIFVLFLLLLFGCSKDKVTEPMTYDPQITSIYPTSFKINDYVIITGYKFESSQGTSSVQFNNIKATEFYSWNDNQIKVKVPTGATTGKVWVIVNNNYSNEVNYTIIPSIDTVNISNQIWMKKNLETEHYRNGDLIPQITSKSDWNSLTTGAWCYYNNDPANGAIYGKLYNWYAVNDPRGLAPEGWHIATDEEWTTLENSLGDKSSAGCKLKSTGTLENNNGLWRIPNSGATNESGFTALPGGWIYNNFENIWLYGYFWTSTKSSKSGGSYAWCRYLSYTYEFLSRVENDARIGMSVRCIKN